jgi:hypothetical protein
MTPCRDIPALQHKTEECLDKPGIPLQNTEYILAKMLMQTLSLYKDLVFA